MIKSSRINVLYVQTIYFEMFEFPVAFVILYDHLRKKGEG